MVSIASLFFGAVSAIILPCDSSITVKLADGKTRTMNIPDPYTEDCHDSYLFVANDIDHNW